jgi:hypothetical protein
MKKRAIRRIRRLLKDPPKFNKTRERAAAVFVALGGDPLAFKRCKFCQSLRYTVNGVCLNYECMKQRALERVDQALKARSTKPEDL